MSKTEYTQTRVQWVQEARYSQSCYSGFRIFADQKTEENRELQRKNSTLA